MTASRFRLPFERSTAGQGGRASERFVVPGPVAARLRALDPAAGADPTPALLAVLQVLLFRYTGRADAPVLVTAPPRRLLAAGLAASIPGAEAVRGAGAALAAPALPPAAAAAATSVSFGGLTGGAPADGDVTLTVRLAFEADGHDLRGRVDYDVEALGPAEVRRLVGHFLRLAAHLAAGPATPVGSLDLLSPLEEARIRQDWNATWTGRPPGRLVPDLVAARTASAPDAVAVTTAGRHHAYAELDTRAAAVAAALQDAGVAPGDVVGLCAERSFDMVCGLLGILRAGAAYLPLDPSYPADRLAYMLDDSGATVVVTDGPALLSLPAPARDARPVVVVAEAAGSAPGAPVPVSPESAAYVIYTSGSTGRPKGVVVPHRAVVNLHAAIGDRIGIGTGDVVLGLSPLSFDISVLELLLTLMAGGRVHLVDRALATDGRTLGAEITRSGASVVQATPATFRMLVAAGWTGGPDLTLICGGEALAPDLAEALLARCRRLWNGYGPTEATVYSLTEPITPAVPVAIGTPLGNTRAYVLDEHLNPLPVGVPGELHLAGDGLAHGYHGRPELTADRFVPDPFARRGGGRLYRTGDLTRWTEDGRVEYLGRVDHQVKLRGYRIELGEIEAVLRGHPAVREAVASVVERADREPVLVAFLELAAGEQADRDGVRAFAAESLPAFMVPAELLVLDHLPLTPSNKVDRRAVLARQATATPLPARASRPPRTAVEAVVASVWLDVLGRDDLGIDEPVFDHGADSLSAQRAVRGLEDVFQLDVAVRTVFEHPTVEAQAVALEGHGRRVGRDVAQIASRLLALAGNALPLDDRRPSDEEAVA